VIGAIVGGYEIVGPLGRGAVGDVYVARKRGEDRSVALKLLGSELTSDDGFRARFEREARVAASLEHPNIVPVYALGEDGAALRRN
jgi:serine/threonine-protein kinase